MITHYFNFNILFAISTNLHNHVQWYIFLRAVASCSLLVFPKTITWLSLWQQATAGTGGPPPTTTHGANITQGANIQQQIGGNTTAQSNNTNQAGGKSWSSVTMGGNKKAGK